MKRLVGAAFLSLLSVPALAQDAAAEAPPADAAPADEAADEAEPESADRGPDAPRITGAGAGGARGGTGIALDAEGNSRLHFRLDAGAGFDTNPYSVPWGAQTNQFPGDVVTRVRPGLELTYPGSLIAFEGDAYVDYGFLPNLFNAGATTWSPQWLLYQSALKASLEVNRGGMFSFAGADAFSMNNEPGVVALGAIFNRLHNDLSLGVGYRPGGGTLRFRLGYTFGFEKWFNPLFGLLGQQASDPVQQGAFDQMTHGLGFRADYRFLPRTGVYGELSGGWHSYPLQQVETNPMSFPVSMMIGLMGQFTPKLSGLVSLGYQNPLTFDNGSIATLTAIGVAGQAEVRWTITPTTKLAGGLKREFSPIPLYQFLTNNRLYARFDQAIGAKFVFSAFAGYSILQFGEEQPVVLDGQQFELTDTSGLDRFDGHLDFRADLSYFMLDWLSLGIANDLDWRLTNANDAGSGLNLSYLRNETLVLASLHY